MTQQPVKQALTSLVTDMLWRESIVCLLRKANCQAIGETSSKRVFFTNQSQLCTQ